MPVGGFLAGGIGPLRSISADLGWSSAEDGRSSSPVGAPSHHAPRNECLSPRCVEARLDTPELAPSPCFISRQTWDARSPGYGSCRALRASLLWGSILRYTLRRATTGPRIRKSASFQSRRGETVHPQRACFVGPSQLVARSRKDPNTTVASRREACYAVKGHVLPPEHRDIQLYAQNRTDSLATLSLFVANQERKTRPLAPQGTQPESTARRPQELPPPSSPLPSPLTSLSMYMCP